MFHITTYSCNGNVSIMG